MTRHIAASVHQAHEIGGAAGRALERAAEASARDAAATALCLARQALAADDLHDLLVALVCAGHEAYQALEVGWDWALPSERRAA